MSSGIEEAPTIRATSMEFSKRTKLGFRFAPYSSVISNAFPSIFSPEPTFDTIISLAAKMIFSRAS